MEPGVVASDTTRTNRCTRARKLTLLFRRSLGLAGPVILDVRGRPRSCEWKLTKQIRFELIGVRKASLRLPSSFTAGGRVGAVSIPANHL